MMVGNTLATLPHNEDTYFDPLARTVLHITLELGLLCPYGGYFEDSITA